MKQVTIIGFGSIGKRHTEVLNALGYRVQIVSRHVDKDYTFYKNLEDALQNQPDYIIIANETRKHFESLSVILEKNYNNKVLVEKPLFSRPQKLLIPFQQKTSKIFVGYVLRFHPLIQAAKQWLEGQKIYSLNAYCGQYLPDWRPNTDYRASYSASKTEGGGVLRDLSHELDYIQFLTGGWTAVVALGGQYTQLEVSSEDTFSFLMTTKNCPHISCHLNYWDRKARRTCTIQAEHGTMHLDFIQNTLWQNGHRMHFTIKRNDLFKKMHNAVLGNNRSCVCTFEEAFSVVLLIQAIEQSNAKKIWLKNQ